MDDPSDGVPNIARLRATPLHNMGITLRGQGRTEEAIALFRAAVETDPAFTEAHFNLANGLTQCGRWVEAITSYRTTAALAPDLTEPFFALGYALTARGRAAEAVTAFRTVLRIAPFLHVAYEPMGKALAGLGRRAEALAAYGAAALHRPDSAALQFDLGRALFETGSPEKALRAFGRALSLQPGWADAHGGMATVHQHQGRHGEALAAGTAAVRQQPDFASAHATRGDALKGLDRAEEAVAAYRRAIALEPAHLQALTHLGDALLRQGRLEDSARLCRAAVTLARTAAPCSGLANALKAMGRVEEAVALFGTAATCAPEDPLVRLNHALALLTLARFEEGWEEYEWRWRTGMVKRRGFTQPQWAGEPLEGRTILLHAEQGMGDTLHFVRYAPLAKARGGRVLLEVQGPLRRLMQRLPGIERVIAAGEPLPAFDLHCPLLGLPRAFATRLDSIPGAVPYLAADPDDVSAWRARVPRDGRLNVGLVWAGEARKGVQHANRIDRQRSLSLEQLAPLAGIPGVRFVNLQKGPPAEQLGSPPPGLEILDLMDGVGDFADTAALVECLDLVVGVDTSVIHLAGGLAKPVWVFSRFDGCWRWLTGRDDTPWYPTMRLYRQEAPGDWAPVIARLAADLRAHATAHMRR